MVGFVESHERIAGDIAYLHHNGYKILIYEQPRRVCHYTILGSASKEGKAEYVFFSKEYLAKPLRPFWADKVI